MKEYKLKINGNEYNVEVKDIDGAVANVSINGVDYEVEIEGSLAKPKTPKITMQASTPSTDSHPAVAKTAKPTPSGAGVAIKSPLPGVILDIYVKEGDTVKVGQHLLMLEAMKMENNIDSDKEGVVKSISVSKGGSVLEGDVLLTIA